MASTAPASLPYRPGPEPDAPEGAAEPASFLTQLMESIFTPGPTPSLMIAANATFGALQTLLFVMLIATSSIHFFAMSILCGGLWWAINWFAREVELARQQEALGRERDLLSGSETETEHSARAAISTGNYVNDKKADRNPTWRGRSAADKENARGRPADSSSDPYQPGIPGAFHDDHSPSRSHFRPGLDGNRSASQATTQSRQVSAASWEAPSSPEDITDITRLSGSGGTSMSDLRQWVGMSGSSSQHGGNRTGSAGGQDGSVSAAVSVVTGPDPSTDSEWEKVSNVG